jgi:hypothetical protein
MLRRQVWLLRPSCQGCLLQRGMSGRATRSSRRHLGILLPPRLLLLLMQCLLRERL